MNTNALGTIAAIVAILLGGMTQILGCTTNAAGNASCAASWLSPALAGLAVVCFSTLQLIMKLFRPGGILPGLFGKTVIVLPENVAGPGSVTQAQVDEK
jgi:ABC-type branched-subunit amino acid transport system permease subunit